MALDFEELRRAMVDSQVRTTDVTDLPLLDALLTVPREQFVPDQQKPFAYTDRDVPLDDGMSATPRYMMQASPFAKMVQLAEIEADDFILDVGCGLGYSSAVLSRLGAAVIAVESDGDLADKAMSKLASQGFDSVAVVTGPLEAGYAAEAPYNVVLVNGSIQTKPDTLLDQLKPGGRLVVVEGEGLDAVVRLYIRDEQGIISDRTAFNASVKQLPGFAKAAEFEF
ncbi:MAG: protein-L-isoaspartate O-methyltransferase [Pseudomonadota bacterium]